VIAVHATWPNGAKIPRNVIDFTIAPEANKIPAPDLSGNALKNALNAYPALSNAANPAPTAAPNNTPFNRYSLSAFRIMITTAISFPISSTIPAAGAPKNWCRLEIWNLITDTKIDNTPPAPTSINTR